MKKMKILPLYIVIAFFCGSFILYVRWPFYEQALTAAIISVPALLWLPRRWIPVFLLGVSATAFALVSYASQVTLHVIGNYGMLVVFQLSLWAMVHQLERIAEETKRLQKQKQHLLKQDGEMHLLSLQEFVEQSLWMLDAAKRKDQTWLMEILPAVHCPKLMAQLERIALDSIIRERDLVTSCKGNVYLLIKEREEALQPFIRNFQHALQSSQEHGDYEIRKTCITRASDMRGLFS